eukprot:317289-Chlamydomonas_euryale.AAC.1
MWHPNGGCTRRHCQQATSCARQWYLLGEREMHDGVITNQARRHAWQPSPSCGDPGGLQRRPSRLAFQLSRGFKHLGKPWHSHVLVPSHRRRGPMWATSP